MTTVTVVIPVYNEERWIGSTLTDLASAARRAPGLDVDVVVVDDGSTDGTAAAARAAADGLAVEVLSVPNGGRHSARRRGLERADGDLVLFLDSRVSLGVDSLAFVAERLEAAPDDDVWNAHVVIETDGNAYGTFWNVLTEMAFSAYFGNPRTTSFGPDEFEAFPKGTTCFLAPRALLEDAFAGHRSLYDDPRRANDDTPLIRRIAEQHRIGISPRFTCLYRPRERLRPFLVHAYHRGIVFLDGHGRPGARLRPAVLGFYPATLALAAAATRRPWLAPAALAAVAAAAAAAARKAGRTRDETLAFAGLAPVYGVAHGLGMWRGALLALAAKARGR